MRKPIEMTTRKTAAAITKINNSLPLFPLGTNDSKFLDQELVGLIEWSLPLHWRKKFDLDGFIPTLGTKAKLILECEAIERNETSDKKHKDDDDNNYNNYKKTSSEILRRELQKMVPTIMVPFSASTAGATTHMICLSAIF
jgi:hypothetical protein